jgi:hypothetical protein
METILNWAAPVAIIVAALMTASNLGSRITGAGFIVFTVGSLCWMAIGTLQGPPSLLWQNAVLTALNLFGVWRWLGREASLEDGGKAAAEASAALPGDDLFPASLFTKGKVLDTSHDEMATCVDAMLESGSGRPTYLVDSQGGVGGVGETFSRLPWSEVSVGDDCFRTSLMSGDLLRYDELKRGEWPGR